MMADGSSNVNGYIRPPLLHFLRWQNIVIDELHSLLRISDKLMELLIEELQHDGKVALTISFLFMASQEIRTV